MELLISIHVPEYQRTDISWCGRVLSSSYRFFDTSLIKRLSSCPYPLESDQTVTVINQQSTPEVHVHSRPYPFSKNTAST